MNNRRKGDFGLLKAIQWFLQNNYEIFLPFSENARHDLIVVKDGKPETVQCKYTSFVDPRKDKNPKKYFSFHPERRSKGKSHVAYEEDSVDYFFITCSDCSTYLIPGQRCWKKKHILLGKKYSKNKIEELR